MEGKCFKACQVMFAVAGPGAFVHEPLAVGAQEAKLSKSRGGVTWAGREMRL